MATADKLITVAENVPKVYHAGQMNIVENADCLKGSKSDTTMLLDDVSPVTHEMGVRVRGKNLSVDVSNRTDVFFSGSPTTTYNITGSQLIKGFAVNGYATNYHIIEFTNSNGTVTFKTSNVSYTVGVDVKVKSGLTYTVSANITGGTSENKPIWTVFLKDGVFQSHTTAQSFIVPNGCNEVILLIRPSATNTECSFSNIQLELGTTATDYEPYNSDIQNVHSKNLIPYPYAETTKTVNGVTFTDNGDGTITVSGTATAQTYFYLFENKTIKAGTYVISGCPSGGGSYTYKILGIITASDGTKSYWGDFGNNGTTNKFTKDVTMDLRIQIESGQTVENLVFKPQLEYGSTATTYTKYHEPYPLVVSRCGKNLFDKNNFNYLLAYINDVGVISPSNADNMYILPCKPNTTYTVSRIANSTTIMVGYYASFPTKGSISIDNARHISSTNATSYTFTTVSGTNYIALRLSKDNKKAVEDSVQIELGSTATNYEPYISPTEYTSNADGTVEGVTSLYPSTTLLTNDPYNKVIIDCNYYKDIDKAFNELTTSVALSGGE